MKFSTDGDSVTVETSREDKQLAEAAAEVVSGTTNLIDSLGLRTCEWCDDKGRLRPYQLTVDGEFQVVQICESCQEGFVEDAVEEHESGGNRLHIDMDGDEDGGGSGDA